MIYLGPHCKRVPEPEPETALPRSCCFGPLLALGARGCTAEAAARFPQRPGCLVRAERTSCVLSKARTGPREAGVRATSPRPCHLGWLEMRVLQTITLENPNQSEPHLCTQHPNPHPTQTPVLSPSHQRSCSPQKNSQRSTMDQSQMDTLSMQPEQTEPSTEHSLTPSSFAGGRESDMEEGKEWG